MEQSAKTKERFSETNESFTMLEAINEAKRCLHCKAPQCSKGCPISQDIPDWIHELSMGNLGNAMHIINGKSNLPAVCGRVCPHERQCEGHCVLGKKGRPVAIGKLERFVADFDGDMQLIRERLPQKTRGRVAVIGSGPAGLAVAGDLARKGFAVEVFEMEPEPGGVLMFGIPEYRLPKEVVRREIRKIEELGVVFRCNTAMDAARSAVRLGAEKVTVVYHRTINDMSALRSEYDEAVSEGVEFEWQSSIVDIHDDAGDITDVVIECNGERHEEDADVVIMAVGSQPASRIVSTTEGIDVDDRGYVLTRDMPYGMTTRKGVFAGGDVVNRPSTVVLAMSDAKKVAEGIAQYVDAIKLLEAIS